MRSVTNLAVLGLLLAGPVGAQQLSACPPAEGVALQVLGSGGPIADDGRASSSYIVWIDGKSRVLMGYWSNNWRCHEGETKPN